jgi:hypothetical protein
MESLRLTGSILAVNRTRRAHLLLDAHALCDHDPQYRDAAAARSAVQVLFCDDRFEREEGWEPYPCPEGFAQRYLRDSDRIYCETRMWAAGAAEAALREICGPWTWWLHGRTNGYRQIPDGSSEQVLSPFWWAHTRIVLHLFPPIPLVEGGWRVPIELRRHLVGTASMDVLELQDGNGLEIRGRYHGVEDRIPMLPGPLAIPIHLRAEAGSSFPRGTGWCGLRARLDAYSGSIRQRSSSSAGRFRTDSNPFVK